jgi:hypothetical protein
MTVLPAGRYGEGERLNGIQEVASGICPVGLFLLLVVLGDVLVDPLGKT